MKIDKNSSDRLSVLRFPLIVGVVFIHTYGVSVELSDGVLGVESPSYFSDFIRNIISQGIARIAVPLFFLMSGYLFFVGFSWSIENYRGKLRSRLRTLLVPFMFWNIITLLLFALAQSIPSIQVYFSGENSLISTYSIYEYINAVFGLDRSPISYQFWFIRDLMVMMLLAPLIYLITKKAPQGVLVGVLLLWFFNYWPVYMPSAVAFAFFYAGAYFANSNINLFVLDRFRAVIYPSYFAVLLIDTFSKEYDFNRYIHNIGVLLGVVSALCISKFIVETKSVRNFLIWAGSFSFFVFATHEPLLMMLKKITYKAVSPDSDVVVLFLYILVPVVVIILSIFIYLGMAKIMPRILSIISGGR